jgi:hypothetical protein
MWLYVNSFRLCVGTYLLEIMSSNQHSNSVTQRSTAMDPLRMVSKDNELCRGEFYVL